MKIGKEKRIDRKREERNKDSNALKNKRGFRNKLTMFFLLFTLSTLLFSGCSSKQKTDSNKKVVKIAYLPITHALPLFEEEELTKNNKDSDFQIELVKFGSWPELLDALNSGRVDGASVLVELAIKAANEGVGLKAVALGHKDGNVIIVSKDINSAKDLKGKSFAIPHRQSSHNILLNDMLKANGMSINDINVVELSPAEMPSALATGQIAGYCVAEPFGAKSVVIGSGKVLYQSSELWEDSVCCGIVLSDKFIKNNTKLADEFIAEYNTAGSNLTAEEAMKIGKEYLKQEENVLDLSLQWISFDDLSIKKDDYNVLVEKMKEYGISDTTLKYEDFVYQPSVK